MTGGTELDRIYIPVDADLSPFKAKTAELDSAADKAATNVAGHFKRAARGTEELRRGVEVSRREILYFGRELVAGDLQRLPGTLLLLGTHMAGLTTSALLMGAAVVAPFALMTVAAVQAQAAVDRVNRSLAATGNAAGISSQQALGIARSASGPGFSQRAALDAEAILAGHGNIVGESSMRGALGATNALQKMTGDKPDDAAKKIEEIFTDPAKGAKELAEQFKLLDRSQQQHVARLEAEGKFAEAQKELADALIQRGKAVQDTMAPLEKGFQNLTTVLSNVWFRFGMGLNNAINPNWQMTPTQQAQNNLKQLYGARDALQHRSVGGLFGMLPSAHNRELGDINARISAAQQTLRASQAGDAAKAAADKARQDQLAKDRAAQVSNSPAALELQRYRDEARVSRAPLRDREMMSARLSAQRDYRANIEKGGLEAGFAGQIESAQIQAERARIAASRGQNVTNAQVSATGAERLAGAWRTGGAAGGERQEAQNKAQEEYLKGSIDDQDAYAAALMRTSEAQRELAAAKSDMKRSDETATLQLEVSLLRSDYDERERQIASLKAKNELVEAGWDLTSAAGQAELARIQSEIDKQGELNKLKREANQSAENDVSAARDATQVVGTLFDHLNEGARGMKSLLPDLTHQMLGMIEKLAILNPMQNALEKTLNPGAMNRPAPTLGNLGNAMQGIFGGPAKQAGSWLGHLFGGPSPGATGAMARGPSGSTTGAGAGVHVAGDMTNVLNVHPDVSAIARGEVIKMMPQLMNHAVSSISNAIGRGFVPGGAGG